MKPAPTILRRHGSITPGGRGKVLRSFDQAARGGRTMFPSRVFEPVEVARILKSGHQSRKIGAFVTKGFAKGWPIFTLTLEERATCPRTCTEWLSCYGNNMPAAERIEAGDALRFALAGEVAALAKAHPDGFLIRLHVLGDFYSAEYARFWWFLLHKHPSLHLFGFSAHAPASPIGREVALLTADFGWRRAAIRFSGQPHELRASQVIGAHEHPGESIPCPAQSGATDCCGTCALCWQSDRSIAFRRH